MVLFGSLFADKDFSMQENNLIDSFITKAVSDFDKKKSLSFRYVLTSGKEKRLPVIKNVSRGNGAAENWRDRVGTDTFVMTNRVRYTVIIKEKEIGTVSFCKYLAERNTENNINTIQIKLDGVEILSHHRFEAHHSSEFGIRLYQDSNSCIGSIYNNNKSIKKNIGYPEFQYSKSLGTLLEKEKKMTPIKKQMIDNEFQNYINLNGHGLDDAKVFFDEKRKELIKLLKKKTKKKF